MEELKIYTEVFTEELLHKLPLTFRQLKPGDKPAAHNTRRYGQSHFHKDDQYNMYGFNKPVSKIIADHHACAGSPAK